LKQQARTQGHAIEVVRSVEEQVARAEQRAGELNAMEPRLAKLESALKQQISLQLHAMAIEDRLVAFEEGWRQHIPAFLNAVSSVGGFGYELSQVKRQIDDVRGNLANYWKLEDAVSQLRETVGALEIAVKNAWEKAGAIDTESGALRDRAEAIDRKISGLRDMVGAADSEIKGLWDKAGAVDKEFHKIWRTGAQHGHEFSDLWHRIEFVRREILFEMLHSAQAERSMGLVPRILHPDKIEVARRDSHLRLNLGCGQIALPDFINVDQRDLPGVDVVAEVGNLPFEKGSVNQIFSAHLLEHFPQEELKRRLLPYWLSLLKPGGMFQAVVPDGEAMIRNLGSGDYSFENFRSVLFGGQDYGSDFHYNLFTPETLTSLLGQAGFTDVETPIKGRVNGQCFEFEIHGRRPILNAQGT
jgi:hypothetical protein